MKKLYVLFMVFACMLAAAACGKSTAGKWQEQYDLGEKYLLEEDYEAAIVAFTAAIEIDPNEAAAYINRAGAYLLAGETEENLWLARTDYAAALELDETAPEAYLGMADVCLKLAGCLTPEFLDEVYLDEAAAVLERGVAATGDSELTALLEKLQAQLTAPDLPETLQEMWEGNGLIYWPYMAISAEVKGYLESAIEMGLAGEWESMWESPLNGLDSGGFWTVSDENAIIYLNTTYKGYKLEYRPESGEGFSYRYEDNTKYENRIETRYSSGTFDHHLFNGEFVKWHEIYKIEGGYSLGTYITGVAADEWFQGEIVKESEGTGTNGYYHYVSYEYFDGGIWQLHYLNDRGELVSSYKISYDEAGNVEYEGALGGTSIPSEDKQGPTTEYYD